MCVLSSYYNRSTILYGVLDTELFSPVAKNTTFGRFGVFCLFIRTVLTLLQYVSHHVNMASVFADFHGGDGDSDGMTAANGETTVWRPRINICKHDHFNKVSRYF